MSPFFRRLIGLILFGVGLYVVWWQIRTYRPAMIIADLRAIPAFRLLISLMFIALDYWVLTFYDLLALRAIGHKLSYDNVVLGSFIGQTFTITITMIAGSAVRYRYYRDHGISAADVTMVTLLCNISFLLGFLALGSFVFLLQPLLVPAFFLLPAGAGRPLGILCLSLLVGYFILSENRWTLRIGKLKVAVPPPSIAGLQLAASCADWLLACAALYVLMPFNGVLGFFGFLGTFLVAHVAGQLSQAPAGLGVFEATVLLMLAGAFSQSAILGSLIVYRLAYYFLPFLAALVMFGFREFVRKKHHTNEPKSA